MGFDEGEELNSTVCKNLSQDYDLGDYTCTPRNKRESDRR